MTEASPKASPRSTRGKVLMVIAAVIVASLGYLAWSTQKPRDGRAVAPAGAPSSQPSRVRRSLRPPSSRPNLVRRTSHNLSSRAPVAASSQPGGDGGVLRTNLTKADVRVAQGNLHRAADPCVAEALKTNPGLGLRMAIRYTLYVQGGEARAVNPRITKSLINDPEVERCILTKLTSARWNVDASDGILHAAESFNFKHLQRTHIE
jgi:hypothetical protein